MTPVRVLKILNHSRVSLYCILIWAQNSRKCNVLVESVPKTLYPVTSPSWRTLYPVTSPSWRTLHLQCLVRPDVPCIQLVTSTSWRIMYQWLVRSDVPCIWRRVRPDVPVSGDQSVLTYLVSGDQSVLFLGFVPLNNHRGGRQWSHLNVPGRGPRTWQSQFKSFMNDTFPWPTCNSWTIA